MYNKNQFRKDMKSLMMARMEFYLLEQVYQHLGKPEQPTFAEIDKHFERIGQETMQEEEREYSEMFSEQEVDELICESAGVLKALHPTLFSREGKDKEG